MILIFVNPFSGSGRNRQRVEALAMALDQKHGLQSQIIDNLPDRRKLLADPTLASRCSCLVVAGGDGTAASVINEMHVDSRDKIPLAMMSVGNENLLARELGVFKVTPLRLAQAIADGRTRRIDVGLATGSESEPRIFTLMASAGLDSDVVGRVEAWRKMPKGLRRATRLSYLKPILAGVMRYQYQPLSVMADGQKLEGSHAFVFNINRYGGGLGFVPDANPADGKLDVVVLQKPGRFCAIRYLTLVALGWHINRKDVRIVKASKVRIESATPLAVQADGDTIGHTTMDFEVIPQAVQFIIRAA